MIDAYIFADTATDPFLRELSYKNITRSLYKVFDVKIILSKDEDGQKMDKILSEAVQELRANGQLQKIEGGVDLPYNNWQPSDH